MKFRLNQLSVAENLFSTNTSGEMTISNAIDINYADLVALKQAGNLMPHRSYRIQDYQTVHFVHAVKPGNVPFGAGDTTLQDEELNTNVASIPVEVLIVTANSTNELRCTAYSETYPTDIIHYELEPSTNQLDTPSTGHFGVITYRRDENGNESYFDFRNTIFPRWEKIPGSGSYNHWIEGGFGGGVVYVRAFDNTKCTNVKIAPFVGLNFSPFFNPYTLANVAIRETAGNVTIEGFGLSLAGQTAPLAGLPVNLNARISSLYDSYDGFLSGVIINNGANNTFNGNINSCILTNVSNCSLADMTGSDFNTVSNCDITGTISESKLSNCNAVNGTGTITDSEISGMDTVTISANINRFKTQRFAATNIANDITDSTLHSVNNCTFGGVINRSNIELIEGSTFGDYIDQVSGGHVIDSDITGQFYATTFGRLQNFTSTDNVHNSTIGGILDSSFGRVSGCRIGNISNTTALEFDNNNIGWMDDCTFGNEVNYFSVNSCKNLDVTGQVLATDIQAITTQVGDTTSRLIITGNLINTVGAYIGYNGGNSTWSHFEQNNFGKFSNINFGGAVRHTVFPRDLSNVTISDTTVSSIDDISVLTTIITDTAIEVPLSSI